MDIWSNAKEKGPGGLGTTSARVWPFGQPHRSGACVLAGTVGCWFQRTSGSSYAGITAGHSKKSCWALKCLPLVSEDSPLAWHPSHGLLCIHCAFHEDRGLHSGAGFSLPVSRVPLVFGRYDSLASGDGNWGGNLSRLLYPLPFFVLKQASGNILAYS